MTPDTTCVKALEAVIVILIPDGSNAHFPASAIYARITEVAPTHSGQKVKFPSAAATRPGVPRSVWTEMSRTGAEASVCRYLCSPPPPPRLLGLKMIHSSELSPVRSAPSGPHASKEIFPPFVTITRATISSPQAESEAAPPYCRERALEYRLQAPEVRAMSVTASSPRCSHASKRPSQSFF